jgi:PDZ domain-containing secreted protein
VGGAPVAAVAALRPLSRRTVAAIGAGVVALAIVGGTTYHPGVLVVRPSAPVDVSHDVTIEGLPARPPAGRYILTTVDISEPTAFGLLVAVIAGEPRLRAATGEDLDANRRALREQHLESRRRAVAQVAERHGHDPVKVHVRFRDRDVWGPSAGLLYALVLADMLGDVEVSEGRVIAATGVLGEAGHVLPVSYVGLKRRVAAEAGADLFLVPAGSATHGAVEVETVSEAIRRVGRTGCRPSPIASDSSERSGANPVPSQGCHDH